jgi:hypothetical protein
MATSHLSPAPKGGTPLRPVPNQDSDSEDDEVIHGSRNSFEIAEHDRTVLEEEDEREKLLASGGAGDGLRKIFSIGSANNIMVGKGERRKRKREMRKAARRERRRNKRLGTGEAQDLMFEMEEGRTGRDSASESSDGSSDIDREKLRRFGARRVSIAVSMWLS